ncbi:5-formyltetrahydrofolate cyclo-ligase [Tellurirhabdus bombi]|uniref:5-formyltetrahydrofolate cyclo-ligase n=1 Tax=Tellurirhabdus bombi TaxID=2907205 RepID=UPI001F475253|nr:5-formyltetrahydrofolate cyclo-ligase [Tellurirhabdus bombi]
MTKAEIRSLYRQKRRSLSKEEWQQRSEAIAERIFVSSLLDNRRVIHIFLPIEKQAEVNTWLIIHRLWREFPAIRIAVSRTDFTTGTMAHYELLPTSVLLTNQFQIPEPDPNTSLPIETPQIDVVFAPLLAFDEEGNRVGYGGGFYDRFLINCRADCPIVGLSLFDPVPLIDDTYEGDITLTHCVTPFRLYTF